MSNYVPDVYFGDLCLTEYPYLLEFDSLDQGAPQTVSEVLSSFSEDGDLEVSTRAGNRTLSLSVLVEGPDFDALAEAGEALAMEADKPRNVLTINPGDGYGAATAFRTFRAAELPLQRSEPMEGARLRRFLLTVKALPYGFSTEPVTVTPTATSVGTARQRLHSAVAVSGSARAGGSVEVSHASLPLGYTMVYAWSGYDTYMPALRTAYRVGAGSVTTDSALVSGKRETGGFEAVIPVGDVPLGQYAIVARVRANSGSGDFDVTTSAGVGPPPGYGSLTNSVETTLTLDTNWTVETLGSLDLPTDRVGPVVDDLWQHLQIFATGAQIDEVWLFNLDIGRLVAADLRPDAGGPLYLLAEAATLDRPMSLLYSEEADGSNAQYVRSAGESWQQPLVTPPETHVLTVTANATSAVTALTYTPSWFMHARRQL